jgi:hypothetical protein
MMRKKIVIKNQGWEPIYQKYKTNENTIKHNPKNCFYKNQQKSSKKPMQRVFIAMKWQ